MYNQVIPTMNDKYYDDEVEIFLKKICLCGLCSNDDKTDKKQIFKCPHYSCGCSDASRWCFMCGCDIKR